MSDLPSIPKGLGLVEGTLETDLTPTDLRKVQAYKEAGLPGISSVTTSQLHRMLDLYMTGSTYTQISSTLEVKKNIVIYLAYSNEWYLLKKEYLNEIQEKIANQIIDTKLRSQEFLLLLIQAQQKRISAQLKRYLSTNDPSNMDGINLKEVSQLMKAIELIGQLDGTKGSKDRVPTVGLNLGAGVDVERTGDNRVTITPKDTSLGNLLKQYAKKEEEPKIVNKSDINDHTGETK